MEQNTGGDKSTKLRETTKRLLREIWKKSEVTWAELFVAIDYEFQGKYQKLCEPCLDQNLISSANQLRQLGSGKRCLKEEMLIKMALWALSKKWGGDVAEEVKNTMPLVSRDLIGDEKSRRRQRRQENKFLEEGFGRVSEQARVEKRRVVSELDNTLRQLTPAGFSYADILYMVHSWLKLNPPSVERGAKQETLMHIVDPDAQGFFEIVFPDALPKNFALQQHINGDPFVIKCEVHSLLSGTEYLNGDIP